MKFLLNVLLQISGLFSIIRTGMGLRCFQNDNAEGCLSSLNHLDRERSKNSSETGLDLLRNVVISCIKAGHQNFVLQTCDQTRKCNKLDLKFQDDDKMTFKFCDKDESGTVCEHAKILLEGNLKKHLEYASCDSCATDECNTDSEGIICYHTYFEVACMMKTLDLYEATGEMENFDNVKRDVLNCWKGGTEKNLISCKEGVCSTLTLKFKDGTQVMSKACDRRHYSVCEVYKKIAQTNLSDFISSVHCDFCSENRCNKALEGSSHPESDESLRCWVTQLKDMCDLELMNWYKAQAGSQEDPDKLKSNALKCLKGNQSDELVPCRKNNSVCSKLTLNFKDDAKTVFKFCDSESLCQDYKKRLENDFNAELKSAQCECVDGCNSNQKGPSPEITNSEPSEPEVKQNKSSSRSSGSCIHLSVFALFLILGAFFI